MKKAKHKTFIYQKSNVAIALLMIMIFIGGVLRIYSCFWGYPEQLHPDEHVIVENAMDMLSRHSWEAYVYNRPDQFEIKCNAIIFSLVSWIKFHMPAYEAFEAHQSGFYLLARFYTAIFGTAMIPLMYIFVGKLLNYNKNRKYIQLTAAGIVAFLPVFITHSAYATPDIPLAFFILLIAYYSISYLEKGQKRYLCLIAAMTGISISIKYPAAIVCLYIAFIVIYKAIKERKIKDIFILGFASISIIVCILFIMAPNLFTDLNAVVEIFIKETGSNHLGVNVLGFWGNLKYYFETILNQVGKISGLFFLIGMAYLLKERKYQHWALGLSTLYWICLSKVALHWERWGIPMYLSYIVVMAIGIFYASELLEGIIKKDKKIKFVRVIYKVVVMVSFTNIITSGLVETKWNIIKDTRIEAQSFCKENGINLENSIYEGYTPLAPRFAPGAQYKCFKLTEKGLKVKKEFAEKKYLVISSTFMGRYTRAASEYPEAAEIYRRLDESYKLVYSIEGFEYQKSPWEIMNIKYGIIALAQDANFTGDKISIYDLQSKSVNN